MKPISNRERVLVIALLSLTVFCTLTKAKIWDYKKIKSIEYNPTYNEINPPLDTISTYYTNTNPIIIRKFKIQGHSIIGEINGGSRNILIHDIPNCEKCTKFFLSLKGG
jgi:hypothetical protein